MSDADPPAQHGESATPRRATYQDVLDAPAHRVAEIIDGTLYLSPRPALRPAFASGALARTLAAFVDRDRGEQGSSPNRTQSPSPHSDWWIIREPELHLGEDVLAPDWVGWRRARMPTLPETACDAPTPDWVCEIVSDSARRLALHDRRSVYAREAIGHLWQIDLTVRTLEAFELHDGQWVLIATAADDVPINIRPFDAITFSLGALWP